MQETAEMFFITSVGFVNHNYVPFSGSQGSAPMAHPEDELERLTKKMLFDMDNPPSEEYFGKNDGSSHTHLVSISLFDMPLW